MDRLRSAQTRYVRAHHAVVCADHSPGWGATNAQLIELESAAAEFRDAQQNAALAQSCGHPRSAIVSADEGTAYCAECEEEADASEV